jgi:hypothetical protein
LTSVLVHQHLAAAVTGGENSPFCAESRSLGASPDILEGVYDDSNNQIDHPEVDNNDTDDKVQ